MPGVVAKDVCAHMLCHRSSATSPRGAMPGARRGRGPRRAAARCKCKRTCNSLICPKLRSVMTYHGIQRQAHFELPFSPNAPLCCKSDGLATGWNAARRLVADGSGFDRDLACQGRLAGSCCAITFTIPPSMRFGLQSSRESLRGAFDGLSWGCHIADFWCVMP